MIVLRSGQRWRERTTRSINAVAPAASFAKDARPRFAVFFAGNCAKLDARLQAAPFSAMEPPSGERQPPKLGPRNSEISPFAFCKYSCARHKTLFQTFSVATPSRSGADLAEANRQYKAAAPIVPRRMTAARVRNARFLIVIFCYCYSAFAQTDGTEWALTQWVCYVTALHNYI